MVGEVTAEMNKKERGIVNRRLEAFVAALCAETEALRSFLEDFRDMEEDKLDSFPDARLDSPAGLLIEEHIGMLDERIDAIDEIESELESSFTGI